MPKPTPRNHRYHHPARRNHRCEMQGNFVADTTRRMFVRLGLHDARQIRHHTGVHHRLCVVGRLLRRHTPPHDRHEHRAQLVVRPRPIGRTADEGSDLLASERVPVALAGDDVLGKRHVPPQGLSAENATARSRATQPQPRYFNAALSGPPPESRHYQDQSSHVAPPQVRRQHSVRAAVTHVRPRPPHARKITSSRLNIFTASHSATAA